MLALRMKQLLSNSDRHVSITLARCRRAYAMRITRGLTRTCLRRSATPWAPLCLGAGALSRFGDGSWARASRRVLERAVQRVEQRHALREQRVIIAMRTLQSVDHVSDRDGLWSAEPVVLQIEVVDDRGDPSTAGSWIVKTAAQRFERAAFPLVAELDAEHVERQRHRPERHPDPRRIQNAPEDR